jgi:hypothetical protein
MLVHVRNDTTLNELVLKYCNETWMLKVWNGDVGDKYRSSRSENFQDFELDTLENKQ